MRTNLLRGVLAVAVLLFVSAAPAVAQSIIRGKVVDGTGKPVEGATVTFEAEGTNRKAQTKTNRNGEFLQVGLQSGAYKITANKEGVGSQTLPGQVSQSRPVELSFNLAAGAAAGAAAADKEAAAALQTAARAATAALNAGQFDAAITQFNDLIVKVPTCGECYYNLGVAHLGKNQNTEAEAALNKSIEIRPTADAHSQLAKLYNSQKKFDLAAAASAKAAELSGGAGGGGNAEALYNNGVILFNGGKFAESKVQFESAIKADPTYAAAYYQLGMAALNVGQIPDAVAALEKYLSVAPDGPKAAEVKASLPALQSMLKK
jgi:tetratricopeptide (TPR) repeat protein